MECENGKVKLEYKRKYYDSLLQRVENDYHSTEGFGAKQVLMVLIFNSAP
jgi:hypothetical protein